MSSEFVSSLLYSSHFLTCLISQHNTDSHFRIFECVSHEDGWKCGIINQIDWILPFSYLSMAKSRMSKACSVFWQVSYLNKMVKYIGWIFCFTWIHGTNRWECSPILEVCQDIFGQPQESVLHLYLQRYILMECGVDCSHHCGSCIVQGNPKVSQLY